MTAGFTLSILLAAFLQTSTARPPVFPPSGDAQDVPRLLRATKLVREMSEAKLVAMVPERSGLNFVGCPNCQSGKQENQLDWSPDRPNEVFCRFCEHRYPSQKYAATGSHKARNPRGEVQEYPYWADAKGYRYYFQARRDDLVREYLADQCQTLARLYAITRDPAHGRRSALILDRFAQVFPGWCFHYDYPFQPKEIYDGEVPPSKFRTGFRTARWSWWAYRDVPIPLVHAYDWLRGGDVLDTLSRERGVDVSSRIEQDLFRKATDQVLANPEGYHNMSPAAWSGAVTVGRVIGEPQYIHEVVARIRHIMSTRFFYDRSWNEGSPDYARQSIVWLQGTLDLLKGYSDPAGYKGPTGEHFERLDLATSLPELGEARDTLNKMLLPDGRPVPVHDTWQRRWGKRSKTTEPYLLPALGHAMLGGESGGQQVQFHLTWSGGYGHEHRDNLGLLIFGNGREVLSDLGYTHTKYRAWTIASASHNLVVIDGMEQWSDGRHGKASDGRLLRYDIGDARVQVVRADGSRGYPGLAKIYRRSLIVVDAGYKHRYGVDVFEVEGGHVHDYFLHGDADRPTLVSTSGLSFDPLDRLIPNQDHWVAPRNEGDRLREPTPYYFYGFLRSLKEARVSSNDNVPLLFAEPSAKGPGLRATLLPPGESRLILGENPSIRLAEENDSRLDRFSRPFALMRHEPPNGKSTFVSILEPFSDQPLLSKIERLPSSDSAILLKVTMGDHRVDLIAINADRPVSVKLGSRSAEFRGEVGVLSFREDAQEVEHAYALGDGGWKIGESSLLSSGPASLELSSVDDGCLVLEGITATAPLKGDVVRVLTSDGWVYPFGVVSVETAGQMTRIRVREGPGMTFDRGERKLKLSSFPQREHKGSVRVEWITHASR